jgi:hypothetical protein
MCQRNLLWVGLAQHVNQRSRKVAKMMNEFSVKVAKLHRVASFLLHRQGFPVFSSLEFLG